MGKREGAGRDEGERRGGEDEEEREDRDWEQERTKPILNQTSNKAAFSKDPQPPLY